MVLGIVRSREDCTAYAVRAVLRGSPSTRWSASAGAIYPLLGRLEERGLVTAKADPSDGRGRRTLHLTTAGKRAHRAWMLRAAEPDVAADVADSIRSRAFFLETLTPAERIRFASKCLDALEAHLAVTELDLARSKGDGSLAWLAAKGGVYQAQARVKWMREVLSHLRSEG